MAYQFRIYPLRQHHFVGRDKLTRPAVWASKRQLALWLGKTKMSGQDRASQSYLSKLSPWSRSPVVPPSKGEHGEPEAMLQQQKGQDHVVNPRHRSSLQRYPRDCPPVRPCWFHATDVPKRRPNPSAGEVKEEKPVGLPKKYSAFSVNDSKAIEVAFQKLRSGLT